MHRRPPLTYLPSSQAQMWNMFRLEPGHHPVSGFRMTLLVTRAPVPTGTMLCKYEPAPYLPWGEPCFRADARPRGAWITFLDDGTGRVHGLYMRLATREWWLAHMPADMPLQHMTMAQSTGRMLGLLALPFHRPIPIGTSPWSVTWEEVYSEEEQEPSSPNSPEYSVDDEPEHKAVEDRLLFVPSTPTRMWDMFRLQYERHHESGFRHWHLAARGDLKRGTILPRYAPALHLPWSELCIREPAGPRGAWVTFIDDETGRAHGNEMRLATREWWLAHMPADFPLQPLLMSSTAGRMLGLLPRPLARPIPVGTPPWSPTSPWSPVYSEEEQEPSSPNSPTYSVDDEPEHKTVEVPRPRRPQCSKPRCAGVGRKKCEHCVLANIAAPKRYCGRACQISHWPVHKKEICVYPGCDALVRTWRCSWCKKARYCGYAHLRAHWPDHQAKCLASEHYKSRAVRGAEEKGNEEEGGQEEGDQEESTDDED
jgi:hypothetical protein